MLSELASPHIRCCLSAIPSDLMKSTAVDESLSSTNQQFCSRENQLLQMLQQNEKSTQKNQESWHRGVLTHSIPPMVLKLSLSSMSSHGGHSAHYLMAMTGWRCLHPLPNTHDPVDIHFHYILPEVFTCPLWMLWWMSMGEVLTSHLTNPSEVWLAWHWVVARPLSTCGIVSLSFPLGVG